ncbi:histone-lysine N-methyltransferase SETD7-like [Sycon ciliatum]|uniref:histone-lysine N-methyltransferase SETD7-like n=1 Tax=Sycon ciliatum TaxID=27933 RepID=UPI0020AE69E3|eukprot:scpid69355/ scgid11504/ Histone-lysine N-methyltransferase SETD7; SET domain-containing protein 7
MPARKKKSKPISSGSKDSQGKLHGRGTERFPSGDVFTGRYKHGIKHGKGMWTFSDGSRLSATFRDDEAHGQGTYQWPDGSQLVAAYCEGQLNGPAIKTDGTGDVECSGNYVDSMREGRWYEVVDEYGAFLLGHLSSDGDWTGEEIAYVYPDKHHALLGQFEDGVLQEAAHATCSGDSVETFAIVADSSSKVQMKACMSTETQICEKPLIPDRYESATAYVAPSQIPNSGEGLFAKRQLKAGELVAYYNGVRLSHSTVDSRDWSENGNCISLDDDTVIDVPPNLSSTTVYCATLGHKANHSFTPNSCYAPCPHPVYGEIKCIHTIADVEVGEEITVHYDYNHISQDGMEKPAPDWYLNSKPA